METSDLSNRFDRVTVAVVSDTHGYVDPRVCREVSQCDIAIHLGDIGSDQVLERLMPKSGLVFAVAGNNDVPSKWESADTDALRSIPDSRLLRLPGGDLAMEHGHAISEPSRYHELFRVKHPQARTVAYGHSHIRVIDQDESPWVINPGAAGRVRTHGGPSLLILTATSGAWSVEECVFEL